MSCYGKEVWNWSRYVKGKLLPYIVLAIEAL